MVLRIGPEVTLIGGRYEAVNIRGTEAFLAATSDSRNVSPPSPPWTPPFTGILADAIVRDIGYGGIVD